MGRRRCVLRIAFRLARFLLCSSQFGSLSGWPKFIRWNEGSGDWRFKSALRCPVSSKKLSRTDPELSQSAASPKAALTRRTGVTEKSQEILTVIIVDDELHERVLMERILEQLSGFRWAGSYACAQEVLAAIPKATHIVLMDIRMPGMSGIECARRLRTLLPHLIIVMVSGLDDPRTIHEAWICGADRFLPKPFNVGQFLATLSFCIPQTRVEVAEKEPRSNTSRDPSVRPLTDRENEFMRHLADGLPFKQIAPQMGVGFWRVHNLQRQTYKKLSASCGIEAIRRWRQLTSEARSHL